MGFWDRARSVLGLGKESPDAATEDQPALAHRPRSERYRKKDDRPPLPTITAGSTATIEDALVAREKGSPDEARAILAAIDKGQGLRTVLRAAAALEAGDEEELAKLLPAVRNEEPAWQLRLQIAAALDAGEKRNAFVREAAGLGAPAGPIAWVRATSSDEDERRRGLVDLLFEDAPLARTVAARDLGMVDVKPDHEAVRRYAAFAHGRDAIKRFGAGLVAALLDRAGGKAT